MIFDRLLEVTQSLIDLRDLDSLLKKIAESAGTVLGADIVILYEFNASVGKVTGSPVTWGKVQYPEKLLASDDDRPFSESTVSKVLERNKPFYADDVRKKWGQLIGNQTSVEDSGEKTRERFIDRENIASSAAIPLIKRGEKVGVLFISYLESRSFGDQERKIIEIFASQAAVAISNTRALERQIKRHQVLHRVSTELTKTLDEKHVMDIVASGAAEAMNCTHCSVFRLEENQLIIKAAKGPWVSELHKGRTFKIGQGLAGWVAAHGESALVGDASKDERFEPGWSKPRFEDPRSLVDVPILLDNSEVYGVISVEQDQREAFDTHDLQLVETLARQASQTVRNARLFEIIKSLHRVVQEQTLEQTLNRILESINFILGAGVSSSINLYDEKNEEFLPSRAFGPLKAALEVPPRKDGTGRHVLKTQEPLYLEDIHHPPSNCPTIRNDPIENEIKSFAAVPLKRQEQIVGVLFVNFQKPMAFSEEIKRILELFASQAAISIENTRLYAQRIMDIAALQDINEAVVSKKLDEVSELIVAKAIAVTSGEYSELWLREPSGDLVLGAAQGPARGNAQRIRRLKKDQRDNINIVVADTRESHICRNTEDESELCRIYDVARSSVTVPLKYQGEVIGTLNVENSRVNAFTEHHSHLLSSFADQAAIAIKNAQHYKEFQHQVKNLNTLNRIFSQIGASMDRQKMLQTIVEEARESLEATRCTLFTLDDEEVLTPQATDGTPLDTIKEFRFRLGEGLAGWVAQEKRACLISDVLEDPRATPIIIPESGVTRSIILAPLWREGKVIGVISADQDYVAAFNEGDLLFLETLAMQAGIAIQQLDQRCQHIEAITRRFNPYVIGGAVCDEDFFGRQQQLRGILDGIHNNNYIVYGERRIGKTSLLLQIEKLLKTVSEQDTEYYFLPVRCNLQGIPQNHFFRFLRNQIARVAPVPDGQLPLLDNHGKYDHLDLVNDLQCMVDALKEQHSRQDIRIVLLLDEMDPFMGRKTQTQQRFRSIFSDEVSKHLKMIVAGVFVQRQPRTRTSPWYNLFKEIELHTLERSEAQELITKPVRGRYTYENQALEAILKFSNLKPQEIQRLCSYAVSVMLARIGPLPEDARLEDISKQTVIQQRDVHKAFEAAVREKDGEYGNLWKNFSEEQQQVLTNAMKTGGFVADISKFSEKDFCFAREDLYNITYFDDQKIFLAHLFMQWLKNTRL